MTDARSSKGILTLVIAGTLLVSLPTGALAQYPGDAILQLTKTQRQPQRQDVMRALTEVFHHLKLPADAQQQYSFISGARLIASREYVEQAELNEAILITPKSVRISAARNVIVISGGDVSVAHGTGLVIFSAGAIEVSHANSLGGLPGVFVSKKHSNIGSAKEPRIYAVEGTVLSNTAVAHAYNTDVGKTYGRVDKYTVAAIFRGEPIRAPVAPSMTIFGGESFPFEGRRCEDGVPIADIFDKLPPMARRGANCPRLGTATVLCEPSSVGEGSGARASMRERWTFTLCDRKLDILVSSSPNARSFAIDECTTPTGARGLFQCSPSDSAKRAGIKKEVGKVDAAKAAVALRMSSEYAKKGDFASALTLLNESIASDPTHALAYWSRASARRRLGDSRGAVDDMTMAIKIGYSRSADAYSTRGFDYLKAGDAERALADFDKATELSADSHSQHNRAVGYMLAGRLAEANAAFARLIARNPRDIRSLSWRAWTHLLTGHAQEAYRDALAVLTEGGDQLERNYPGLAGHAVLCGILALKYESQDARAKSWLQQWKHVLNADRAPDAVALQVLGVGSAMELSGIPEQQRPLALAFMGLNALVDGHVQESQRLFSEVMSNNSGFDMPRMIAERAQQAGPSLKGN